MTPKELREGGLLTVWKEPTPPPKVEVEPAPKWEPYHPQWKCPSCQIFREEPMAKRCQRCKDGLTKKVEDKDLPPHVFWMINEWGSPQRMIWKEDGSGVVPYDDYLHYGVH